MTYEIRYDGNKRIEQSTFHVCSDCNSKLSGVNSKSVNKFRSMTCSGCSSTLREAAEGKEEPDFASFIITVLEKIDNDSVITRLTRAQDIEERAGGAVKISRAVVEAHDAIQAHVYSDRTEFNDAESALSEISPSLSKARSLISNLPNFDAEVTMESTEDFTDVYVIFYHVKAPR